MSTDLTLDGMPEPPPAWVRPDMAVRMAAQDLDWMLAAALPHAGTDEQLPALMALRLQVSEGLLTCHATDRYTLIRERRPVSQTCDDWTFQLRTEDAANLRALLKSVLRGLKDEARAEEPVDLALEPTDDGPTLRVLGQDLDVRFTEHDGGDYPAVDGMLEGILDRLDTDGLATFEATLNPTLLARTVALQEAGRALVGFLHRCSRAPSGRLSPVVITTADEDDDVVIAVMPVRAGEDA